MDCFKCKQHLSDPRFLSKHFRLVHGMKEDDDYICSFSGNCNKFFSNLTHLNRHFKGHLQVQLNRHDSNSSQHSSLSLATTSTSSQSSASNSETDSEFSYPLSLSLDDTAIQMDETLVPSESEIMPVMQHTQENSHTIEESGIAFALELHNNNNFTRKNVIQVQSNIMRNVLQPIVAHMRRSIKDQYGDGLEQRLFVSSLVQEISEPFRACESDHQLFEWLTANDYMSNYNEFIINTELSEIHRCGEIRYDKCDVTGVLLPIQFQFRKFFEKNDLLLKTLKDIDRISRNPELNSHFIHGRLWREKSKSFVEAGKIVLPFFLYIDDCEINNPLGSHCDPISFLYYSFPVVQNCQLFLAAAMKGKHYKDFGNERSLRALVHEIKFLEENGIAIQTSEGSKRVHFILGLVLGDNLGINTILGFSSSFNHNFFCRFCKVIKETTHQLTVANTNLLRNPTNYAADVAANDLSSTGIAENSILNSINSFQVTTNYCVDVMHDIFEGICHYDLCHVIHYLIRQNYFSIETLNVRKQMFNYGEIEIGNFSCEINLTHLNNHHLKMTAREMMTFVHLFPLMVGDLVPQDDEVWIFLLSLIEIIEILLCFEIPRDLAERLQLLIKQHHTDYIRLFYNSKTEKPDTLKPKHHLMLHYLSVILQSGPPRLFWCFRYEAFHKEFKAYARSITSRKNICVTLAKKYQLKFAHSIMQPPSDSLYTVQECNRSYSQHNELIDTFCRSRGINTNFTCYSKCVYLCKTFKRGYYISQYADTIDIDNTLIFIIAEIILIDGCDTPHLVCKHTKILKYYNHFAAFSVDISCIPDPNDKFSVVSLANIVGPPVNLHKTARGLNMIRPRQYC